MAGSVGEDPRGKIAALRALHARGGSTIPGDIEAFAHPLVTAARETGESLITAWRLAYELPPTDPRFLAMTEDEIIHDLLVRRFHDEHIQRVLNPAEAEIAAMAANPAKAGAALAKVKKAALESTALQRALQAIGVGAKAAPKATGDRSKVTVRTSPARKKDRTAP